MPVITEIDQEARLATHRLEGRISYTEVVESIGGLFGNPDFDPAMAILIELSPGATSGLSAVDITRLIQGLRRNPARRGPGRTAVVASAAADLGMVRVIRDLLRDSAREAQVFKDRDEALRWLGK